MNLTEDEYPINSVIQSSLHTITTTIYRSKKADILLCDRAYLESLFDAFVDVGTKVGMLPTGIKVLPPSF